MHECTECELAAITLRPYASDRGQQPARLHTSHVDGTQTQLHQEASKGWRWASAKHVWTESRLRL